MKSKRPDYLERLHALYQAAWDSKNNFLDLLEALNLQDEWIYEEIVGWSAEMFQGFVKEFDGSFDSLNLQVDSYLLEQGIA